MKKKTTKQKKGCGHSAIMHAGNGDDKTRDDDRASRVSAYTGCMQPGVEECFCVRFVEPAGWTPDQLNAKCGGAKK